MADEGGRRLPRGILTDRDIVVGVVARDHEHLATLDVGNVLREDVDLVTARETDDVLVVLAKMEERGLRRCVVVDGKGLLVGLVTVDDILPVLRKALDAITTITSSQAAREGTRRP